MFQHGLSVHDVFQTICLKKQIRNEGRILLFIDEIQNCPEAIAILRYFYERLPETYVIAAGSLLEIILHEHNNISFPVGRVQHHFLYPLTFKEFLIAIEAEQAV